MLFDRNRLAGERRFFDLEIDRLINLESADFVAGAQQKHIAGH